MSQLDRSSKLYRTLYTAAQSAYRHVVIGVLFPLAYRHWAKRPLDPQKAIFLSHEGEHLLENMELVKREMESEGGWKLSTHVLDIYRPGRLGYIRRCLDFLKDAADARAIFTATGSVSFSKTRFRSQTVTVQLWHAAGAFKKFGFSVADTLFSGDTREQTDYPYYANDTYATVSSQEVVWAYEEAMGAGKTSKVKVVASGVSRTDIFFDEAERIAALERVAMITAGASRTRKVVLYAPTFRGSLHDAAAPDGLDIARLRQALGEGYLLLVKHHPAVKKLPAIGQADSSFAFDVSGERIEQMLMAADILVTDYSSVVFEYSLLDRPMVFFAFDLGEFSDWRGFYYPYDTFCPGPVVMDTPALARAILAGGESGGEQVRLFRERFMGACDGSATRRILALALGPGGSCE